MLKIPDRYADQPELVAAVIEARTVQMETEDTAFAIEWLQAHHAMSIESAARVLEDKTFRYPALYPEGHPGLEAMRAEQRAKSRRSYRLKKLRPAIIDRDDGRCQACGKRVEGGDASLDHKDPEGPETLENIHLLCKRCNTLKGKRTWAEFQKAEKEWRTQLEARQAARPDVICKQSDLSIRGRTWEESGCLTPDLCILSGECDNGGYAEFEAERKEFIEYAEEEYRAASLNRMSPRAQQELAASLVKGDTP